MASTTTIPEVSTNEGPGGDDGRIAESAATAEATDSEEETWYTPQDAVEAGRSVKADLLRGTSTLNLTGGVVRLAPKGPWLLVKSRKGGSAKGQRLQPLARGYWRHEWQIIRRQAASGRNLCRGGRRRIEVSLRPSHPADLREADWPRQRHGQVQALHLQL